MRVVDVIIPLGVPNHTYSYSLPEELDNGGEMKGRRVIVPFGPKRYYSGVVAGVKEEMPLYELKEVVACLDEEAIVSDVQLDFWRWMAEYYICSMGEVMVAALPNGLKLSSQTMLYFNEEYVQEEELSAEEERFLLYMSRVKQSLVDKIEGFGSQHKVLQLAQGLVDKGGVWLEEVVASGYRPKEESYVKLHQSMDEGRLTEVFEQLESKAVKQCELLSYYVQLSNVYSVREEREVSQKELVEKMGKSGAGALKALVEKQVLVVYKKVISRLNREEVKVSRGTPTLSAAQERAFEGIKEQWKDKGTVLLYGITSCGKTEIYIKLIEEVIREGKQVLYLLPEIALTTQIIERLRAVFGDQVGVYHSKYPDPQRVEVFHNVRWEDGYKVVLTVRAGIFLPFRDLGMIIVDEEHEVSYKQGDPAPRFNARDAAIYLGHLHKAKVLLGSATPSVESYYNALQGRYGLVSLTERYSQLPLPKIRFANTREARRDRRMQQEFHPELVEAISRTLAQKQQVILFQNRRGFAPYLQCSQCGYIPECTSCNLKLTYHKSSESLQCHYCGYTEPLMYYCPECESPSMMVHGFGTEKIEESIKQLFPDVSTARLDLDTARTRKDYIRILEDFREQKTQILIGTQMVSKGLDFANVSLAAVLDADFMLHFPDFRAHERSLQLMIQVSGRSGRAQEGQVIIQTGNPYHEVLLKVQDTDYVGFYEREIKEREAYSYPPFYRLIRVRLRHRSYEVLHDGAGQLAEKLREKLGKRVLGPEVPSVNRLKNYYIENILLKIERKASIVQVKGILKEAIETLVCYPQYKMLRVDYDVDPQ